ncbi:MAG TPA: EAL domain-containing protein [Caulobacteraceae bacterium]|jgi:signal transduction histidine kinase/EAL domain-containing protein (putative c-di-GMP-specific phosphodiesterase class I)/DNA-binding response OmpR family regulator
MIIPFVKVKADPAAKPRQSIARKLLVLVAASVGTAAALTTGVSIVRESQRDAVLQTQRLQATAAVLASTASESVQQRDPAGAFAAIRAISIMPEVSYARVEDAQGYLLAETGAGARLVSDLQVTARGGSGGWLSQLRSRSVEVSASVRSGRDPIGKVVILGKAEGVAGRLIASLLASLAAGLAAGVIGLAVAWRLQRRITRPIVDLTRSMHEVQRSHDFAREVEISSNDEVGELVRGFNRMMAEIRARDEKIADHVEGLERTVEARTADYRVARNEAEAANSAKSDFLATMSHEIRTPMNGIMVMAEMLAAGELPPRMRRFAEVIAKSGSSLLAIINDILDFSKIEAGKLELDPTPVDPADLVDDVLSLFWERARSKGLDLAGYVDPATPALISADEVRLRQVISNLVNNAIKFTEAGGVFVEVGLLDSGRLKVAVRDTGIGIPADKIDGLFGAFTQADQSTTRKFGGTGLGLAISKRLVDTMGGVFKVTSEVGRGSVFAFAMPCEVLEPAKPWPSMSDAGAKVAVAGAWTSASLRRYLAASGLSAEAEGSPVLAVVEPDSFGEAPAGAPVVLVAEYSDSLARLEAKADACLVQPFRRRDLRALLEQLAQGKPLCEVQVQAARGAGEALPNFTGYRVLVADDSAVNREVAAEALSRLGVTCAMAEDGRQAVEAVEAESFDLVLMDGSMPEMDGYEAAHAIRAREGETGRARLPIVALTAHVVGKAADAWRESGMDAVLHKPFTLAALAGRLGQFLTPKEGAAPVRAVEAAPVNAAAGDELIDPQVAGNMRAMAAEGRGDFVERVLELYRNNTPASLSALTAAFESGDSPGVAKAAHALKSMSLNIGARRVAAVCAKVEAEAREGTLDPARLPETSEAVAATLAALANGYAETAAAAPAEPAAAPVTTAAMPVGSLNSADRELLGLLEGALERDELALAYQLQTDRDGVEITGVECLLRWPTAPKGVGPATFIPLAETSGLVRKITPWVIDRAMRETADLAPLSLAFNASALDMVDPGFPRVLADLIHRHEYDPARLVVEITETAILHNQDQVKRTVDQLKGIGVQVALDDFGAGYSSLSHVRQLPFDKLKIDRDFVSACIQDVKCAAVVYAVVSMGRALGIKVIAEGVETELQHRFLKVAGVHAMQGYLFGKPEPVEMLRARLAEPVRARSA